MLGSFEGFWDGAADSNGGYNYSRVVCIAVWNHRSHDEGGADGQRDEILREARRTSDEGEQGGNEAHEWSSAGAGSASCLLFFSR
jgi:hypothetical protein